MYSTWFGAAFGGALIGVSASLWLWTRGRIAGISGIVAASLDASSAYREFAVAFVLGLISAGTLGRIFGWRVSSQPAGSAPYWLVALGGLLVGVGTQIGGGCTSGHGVCGIGRGSPRSLAATATFMLIGICTVYLVRHLLGGAS